MKKLLILIALGVATAAANAQTFHEWFRQKATQKKYLLQQVAALQVYIGYQQKGYSIARQGLTAISDSKHGEFNLHEGYFNSLKTANPKIKNYSKVAYIISLQVSIVKTYKAAIKQIKQSGSFNARELAYVNGVFERLLDDCAKTIDELITVVTNGQLEMKDDERVKRIDLLYTDMQDKNTFAQSFANDAKLLGVARIREQNDIETMRSLNAIKK